MNKPIVDLFLRTYPGDYKWLPYLFRSLEKFAYGFRSLILTYPEDVVGPSLAGMQLPFPVYAQGVARLHVNDYIGQQLTKLTAWQYTDADQIFFLDSDLVFTKPFGPKPLDAPIECRAWDNCGQAKCWREPTRWLLSADPPFETMARHPFQFSRRVIQRCFEGVGGLPGLLAIPTTLSEFNLLGNWAILYEGADHVKVNLGDSTVETRPDDICRQFHSWGGLGQEQLDEIERILR